MRVRTRALSRARPVRGRRAECALYAVLWARGHVVSRLRCVADWHMRRHVALDEGLHFSRLCLESLSVAHHVGDRLPQLACSLLIHVREDVSAA